MQAWIETGSPRIHWLPAFFSAQSFLVAIQQNYSRTHGIAYNLLTFDYLVNLFISLSLFLFAYVRFVYICVCVFMYFVRLHTNRQMRRPMVNVYRKLDA